MWIITEAHAHGPLSKKFRQQAKESQDPIVTMRAFGSSLMAGAESSFFVSLGVAALTFTIVGPIDKFTGAMKGAMLFTISLLMVVFGALATLWSAGALLAIYVPLIPFLIFMVAALGWVVAVIEAFIGAPILALGFVAPHGEELGRAGPGLMILANIFLRPTLMIFGFILGAKLLYVGMAMLNGGIGILFSDETAWGVLRVLAAVVKITLYAGLAVALTSKCFNLIHIIPNKVLRWMGGTPEAGFGEEGIMQEAKGAYQAGAQASGEVAKGVSSAGWQAAGKSVEHKKEK